MGFTLSAIGVLGAAASVVLPVLDRPAEQFVVGLSVIVSASYSYAFPLWYQNNRRLLMLSVAGLALSELLLVLGAFSSVEQRGMAHAISFGCLLGCALTALIWLATAGHYLLGSRQRDDGEETATWTIYDLPPEADWTASGWFLLSQRRALAAFDVLSESQLSLFFRQYEAAASLLARNHELRQQVRTAQSSLSAASVQVAVCIFLAVQVRLLVTPTDTIKVELEAYDQAAHEDEVSTEANQGVSVLLLEAA